MGRPLVAFLQVLLRGTEAERRFVATVTKRPEVLECHHVTGEWSYLLKLRLSEVVELEDFLTAVIKPLEGVERTHSLLALSSPKDSAELPCWPPETERWQYPGKDESWALEWEDFLSAVVDGKPLWGGAAEDGVAVMRVLDALYRSASTSQPVAVPPQQ